MTHPFEQYRLKRQQGNEAVLETDSLAIKRIFGMDKTTYKEGALSRKNKELLAMVVSLSQRCNDCIDYHLEVCVKLGWEEAELDEAMSVALLVGGTIVIPHLRHARQSLKFLLAEKEAGKLPVLED